LHHSLFQSKKDAENRIRIHKLTIFKDRDMTQNFDAIIIGAGVIGTSIAFHLTERGLKPVILERRQLGFGANRQL